MTYLEAANARRIAAQAAESAGDYAAAARDYTLAAEQLVNVWWQMHRSVNSPDAVNMRRKAVEMIRLRDAA